MTDSEESRIARTRDAVEELVDDSVTSLHELADVVPDGELGEHLEASAINIELQSTKIKDGLKQYAYGNHIQAIATLFEGAESTSGDVARAGTLTTVLSFIVHPLLPVVTTPVVTLSLARKKLADNRELHAVGVKPRAVPDEAVIHDTDEAQLDNDDIQLLLDNLVESDGDEEKLEQSLKRIIDFDAIENLLDGLEFTEIDDGYDGYYVEHRGEIVVLMLHTP